MTMARSRPLVLPLALALLAVGLRRPARRAPRPSSPAPSGPASAIAAHEVPARRDGPRRRRDVGPGRADRRPGLHRRQHRCLQGGPRPGGHRRGGRHEHRPGHGDPRGPPHRHRRARSSCSTSRPTPWPSQAWGGAGWTGAELDGVVPLPADAPAGTPSLAAAAGRLRRQRGHARRRLRQGAPGRPGPARIRPRSASRRSSSSSSPPTSPPMAAACRPPRPARRPRYDLLPLAAAGPVVAAPAIDLTLLCSGPSGWIDAVVQNLEAALINAMPPGIVGTILGAALSWFIHIAAGARQGPRRHVPGPGPDAHPRHRRDRVGTRRADRLGHALHGPGHRRPQRRRRRRDVLPGQRPRSAASTRPTSAPATCRTGPTPSPSVPRRPGSPCRTSRARACR